MATAALDTALTAKLPHFTEPVGQEIEKVTEDFAENLVGDAIMGTPFNLETWIEDELTSEIANKTAKQGANYLDKLRKQKSAYLNANGNGKGLFQNSSTGLPKQKQDATTVAVFEKKLSRVIQIKLSTSRRKHSGKAKLKKTNIPLRVTGMQLLLGCLYPHRMHSRLLQRLLVGSIILKTRLNFILNIWTADG